MKTVRFDIHSILFRVSIWSHRIQCVRMLPSPVTVGSRRLLWIRRTRPTPGRVIFTSYALQLLSLQDSTLTMFKNSNGTSGLRSDSPRMGLAAWPWISVPHTQKHGVDPYPQLNQTQHNNSTIASPSPSAHSQDHTSTLKTKRDVQRRDLR